MNPCLSLPAALVLYRLDAKRACATELVAAGPRGLAGEAFFDQDLARVYLSGCRSTAEVVLTAVHEWAHLDVGSPRHDLAFSRALCERWRALKVTWAQPERTAAAIKAMEERVLLELESDSLFRRCL